MLRTSKFVIQYDSCVRLRSIAGREFSLQLEKYKLYNKLLDGCSFSVYVPFA